MSEDINPYSDLASREAKEHAEYVVLQAAYEAEAAAMRKTLEASAPSLLAGRLPEDQETRLSDGGWSHYMLGSRQQSGWDTPEAAAQDLLQQGGSNPNIMVEYLFFDANSPEDMIDQAIRGFGGHRNGGRVLIVLPYNGEPWAWEDPDGIQTNARELWYERNMPREDFFVRSADGEHDVVNGKYIAGFVAIDGTFAPNTHFMVDSAVTFLSPQIPLQG